MLYLQQLSKHHRFQHRADATGAHKIDAVKEVLVDAVPIRCSAADKHVNQPIMVMLAYPRWIPVPVVGRAPFCRRRLGNRSLRPMPDLPVPRICDPPNDAIV